MVEDIYLSLDLRPEKETTQNSFYFYLNGKKIHFLLDLNAQNNFTIILPTIENNEQKIEISPNFSNVL